MSPQNNTKLHHTKHSLQEQLHNLSPRELVLNDVFLIDVLLSFKYLLRLPRIEQNKSKRKEKKQDTVEDAKESEKESKPNI